MEAGPWEWLVTGGCNLLLGFLSQPALAIELLLLALVLLGVGKALGVPLLFWHERPWAQFAAGVGSTLLVLHLWFLAHVLRAGERGPSEVGDLRTELSVLALGWLLFVAVASLFGRRAVPLARAMGDVREEGSGQPASHSAPSSDVPPWDFLVGTVVGMGLVALAITYVGPYLPQPEWLEPLLDWANRKRPLYNPELHWVLALIFATVFLAFLVLRSLATPALGVVMALALVGSSYGFLMFWLGLAGVAFLPLLLLLLGGLCHYKLRLRALRDFYPSRGEPVDYLKALRGKPQPQTTPLFVDQLSRPGPNPVWPELGALATDSHSKKRPIVLVCTSGGGIRAATWTAGILERLTQCDGFLPATRMVTGASGGMVGAAFWVASLATKASATLTERGQSHSAAGQGFSPLFKAVSSDSLTPLAQRWIFNDLALAFLPLTNEHHWFHDRAHAMEAAWVKALRLETQPVSEQDGSAEVNLPSLGGPVADLEPFERDGRLPTLVFSPMLVEDGRRLIISNAGLGWVTDHSVDWLHHTEKRKVVCEPNHARASKSAVHLTELFPNSLSTFPLSTAARLSAAFPYVSPAVSLPTEPRRRVVDAGYYDNYGLDLACTWLREAMEHHREWIRENVSGILIIQIRDGVSQLTEANSALAGEAQRGLPSRRSDASSRSSAATPASTRSTTGATKHGSGRDAGTPVAVSSASPAAPGTDLVPALDQRSSVKGDSWTGRALEGITSPIAGLLKGRESVMVFRNDGQLESLQAYYRTVLQEGTGGAPSDAAEAGAHPNKNARNEEAGAHLNENALNEKEPFITTTVFELRSEVSLSWYLTRAEKEAIYGQAESAGIGAKVECVQKWLREHGAASRSSAEGLRDAEHQGEGSL